MSDKAVIIVAVWLVLSFFCGWDLARAIRWADTGSTKPKCNHKWQARGYGGAGWTLSVCTKCGQREIDPT